MTRDGLMFPMAIGFFLIIWGIPISLFLYFALREEPTPQTNVSNSEIQEQIESV